VERADRSRNNLMENFLRNLGKFTGSLSREQNNPARFFGAPRVLYIINLKRKDAKMFFIKEIISSLFKDEVVIGFPDHEGLLIDGYQNANTNDPGQLAEEAWHYFQLEINEYLIFQ
jgi:hypothetical protein